jgi:galactokinase
MAEFDLIIERVKGNTKIFKELYGSDGQIVLAQKKRYIELIKQFIDEFGESDIELFSAPGRTEISGNHTDHNHGRVLAAAVDLDNIAVVAPNSSNIVHVKSIGFEPFEVDIDNLQIEESEFYTSASLVKGICARMKSLGYEIGGFDACIDGRVPKGSGLSSSASFEVLIGSIISHVFNNGTIPALQIAQVGQWAENNYFGKPCGLMDQTACAVGGFISIDFENPANPIVHALDFDFAKTGYALVITDTGGNHANLNGEYAALPGEMKVVAAKFGADVLRGTSLDQIIAGIPMIRRDVGDRAILRSIHFHNENQRVADQENALSKNDFERFLSMVVDSGYSSFMYNQNIFVAENIEEQGVALGLALSAQLLKGIGAWRVHGGGFAGTIQAFVPKDRLDTYIKTMEHVFGKEKCHVLSIRPKGAIKVIL